MPSLAEPNLCVGCSACASICPKRCIEMETDSDGFRYPVLMHPTNCVECGMCTYICPSKIDVTEGVRRAKRILALKK